MPKAVYHSQCFAIGKDLSAVELNRGIQRTSARPGMLQWRTMRMRKQTVSDRVVCCANKSQHGRKTEPATGITQVQRPVKQTTVIHCRVSCEAE